MARRHALIEVTDATHSKSIPVAVGSISMQVPVGKPVEVPEVLLGALDASHVVYRVLARPDGMTKEEVLNAPVNEGFGASGVDLSLLDQSVGDLTAALADVSDEGLMELLMAEHAGKTRKSAVAAIEAEIDRRKE